MKGRPHYGVSEAIPDDPEFLDGMEGKATHHGVLQVEKYGLLLHLPLVQKMHVPHQLIEGEKSKT